MDVLVNSLLNVNDEIHETTVEGKLENNKLKFNDDYENIFDIEKLVLERRSLEIHSYFDFDKSKITYYVKQLDNNLIIDMKVININKNENEIEIDYYTYINEEKSKCKYTISWRKL